MQTNIETIQPPRADEQPAKENRTAAIGSAVPVLNALCSDSAIDLLSTTENEPAIAEEHA